MTVLDRNFPVQDWSAISRRSWRDCSCPRSLPVAKRDPAPEQPNEAIPPFCRRYAELLGIRARSRSPDNAVGQQRVRFVGVVPEGAIGFGDAGLAGFGADRPVGCTERRSQKRRK